jgi:hypothetical protein
MLMEMLHASSKMRVVSLGGLFSLDDTGQMF